MAECLTSLLTRIDKKHIMNRSHLIAPVLAAGAFIGSSSAQSNVIGGTPVVINDRLVLGPTTTPPTGTLTVQRNFDFRGSAGQIAIQSESSPGLNHWTLRVRSFMEGDFGCSMQAKLDMGCL